MEILSTENFRLEAERHYKGRKFFSQLEFEEDFKLFQTVARTLLKYKRTGVIQIRQTVNSIIILHNCFGRFAVDGLFFKVDNSAWRELKTILLFLNLLPQDYAQQDLANDEAILRLLEQW